MNNNTANDWPERIFAGDHEWRAANDSEVAESGAQAYIRADLAADSETCTWTEDGADDWTASCGRLVAYQPVAPTGDAYEYCPFCGRKIKDVPRDS